MRLRKSRMPAAAFILAFICGTLGWSGLVGPRASTAAGAQDEQQKRPSRSAVKKAPPAPFVRFEPARDISGYVTAEELKLRESPRADSRVVAKLRAGDFSGVEILETTQDFLRLRLEAEGEAGPEKSGKDAQRKYEGWATWRDVVPSASAIVLDTETGAVVQRLALPEQSGLSSVAFSPDGSRAIFYSTFGGRACEVSTSDYKVKRCLKTSDTVRLESIFFGPADDALYTVVRLGEDARALADGGGEPNGALSLLRVSTGERVEEARELSDAATGFLVSQDGSTGFITHREMGGEATLEVFDTATQAVRNIIRLTGPSLITHPAGLVVNRDGSILYSQEERGEDGESQNLSLIETRTGQRIGEWKIGTTDMGWYLDQNSVVGNSLFFRVWDPQAAEHPTAKGMWVEAGARAAAEEGIAYAVEVGGARFGLDEYGTELFRLDEKNRIRQRYRIPRPELGEEPGASDSFSIFSILPSPDGKRIIVITGQVDGC